MRATAPPPDLLEACGRSIEGAKAAVSGLYLLCVPTVTVFVIGFQAVIFAKIDTAGTSANTLYCTRRADKRAPHGLRLVV